MGCGQAHGRGCNVSEAESEREREMDGLRVDQQRRNAAWDFILSPPSASCTTSPSSLTQRALGRISHRVDPSESHGCTLEKLAMALALALALEQGLDRYRLLRRFQPHRALAVRQTR